MITPDDILRVRTSFALVVPIKEAAADLFYNRLFEIAPQVRALFPDDGKADMAAVPRRAQLGDRGAAVSSKRRSSPTSSPFGIHVPDARRAVQGP
jgi:hypothetical protein